MFPLTPRVVGDSQDRPKFKSLLPHSQPHIPEQVL